MSPYCDKNYPTSKIDFNLMHVKSHAIISIMKKKLKFTRFPYDF